MLQNCVVMYAERNKLFEYEPPEWCKRLPNIPGYKLSLAQVNTPIHRWHCPGFPPDVQLYIKRDDLTGCAMSGNKVRKLEFIMAEAVSRGVRHVVSWGGVQSNFCRTLAVSARQLGITPHVIVRQAIAQQNREQVLPWKGRVGNLLLKAMVGTEMYQAEATVTFQEMEEKAAQLAKTIEEDTGEKAMAISCGGSDHIGMFGYISAFEELLKQGVADNFDDIVVALGSGGTAAGLAVSNYLSGSLLRIHGVMVTDPSDNRHEHMQQCLTELGLDVPSENIIDIIGGFQGLGYGKSTKEEIDYLLEVSRATGIFLDPVYTLKAVLGMLNECRTRPDRFKGKRILFIHTGGMFCNMDGRLETSLDGQ